MGKHLVLAGAGHAHLTTISAIRSLVKRGHEVTVIAPSDHHYYSGMAPGLLAGTYRPQEIRFNVRKLATGRGGRFLRGKVSRIEADRRAVILEDGQRLTYDVASFNVGSMVPSGSLDQGGKKLFTVKPIERILAGREAVMQLWCEGLSLKALDLVVVGGGPAGVEMAGGLWRLSKDNRIQSRITIVAGDGLLRGFPRQVSELARRSLEKRQVTILENSRAVAYEPGRVTLKDGSGIPADVTFVATGVVPPPLFRDSGIATGTDRGMLVNHFLQSVQYPEIFGGGDCVTVEGEQMARVGVYAVRQNPVLLQNLAAALEDKPLQRFSPGNPSFLLILNMGNGKGVYRKGNWIWMGRPAYWLKDFIDRRFMRKFQLSGELEEEEAKEPGI